MSLTGTSLIKTQEAEKPWACSVGVRGICYSELQARFVPHTYYQDEWKFLLQFKQYSLLEKKHNINKTERVTLLLILGQRVSLNIYKSLSCQFQGVILVPITNVPLKTHTVDYPQSGFTAFFMDLVTSSGISKSTLEGIMSWFACSWVLNFFLAFCNYVWL